MRPARAAAPSPSPHQPAPARCLTNGRTGGDDEQADAFEVHESGALLHETKADLVIGDLLVPGRPSNFGEGRIANHVYVTATLDAATWGAELALGDGRGRIYIVEPLGAL